MSNIIEIIKLNNSEFKLKSEKEDELTNSISVLQEEISKMGGNHCY